MIFAMRGSPLSPNPNLVPWATNTAPHAPRQMPTPLQRSLTFTRNGKHTAKVEHYPENWDVRPPIMPHPTASHFSMTLSSSLESVDRLERTAEEFAESAGLDEEVV